MVPPTKDIEPASFKDPGGRVITKEGRIFRELNSTGQRIWNDLSTAPFFPTIVDKGLLIKTWASEDSSSLLEHEKIPFLSYVYEWPPSLLKKAALLHLNLIDELLKYKFILKDATPFNVQFRGTDPIFIDVLSIEKHVEGDPWAGYGQYCDTMLYPLLLWAYKDLPYHDWIKGSLGGIPPEHISPIFGLKDMFKGGVMTHVKLRSLLHKKFQNPTQVKRTDIQKAHLPVSSIKRNIAALKDLISNLRLDNGNKSHWASYTETLSYDKNEVAKKKDFVKTALEEVKPTLTWDMGCNTGDYTELACEYSDLVVAFDNDISTIEMVTGRLEEKKIKNVLPLVMDLTNPSPNLGWSLLERKSIFDRGKPDLILALALVHHLAVRGNVPLSEQVRFLHTQTKKLIVEYVGRDDPMFKQLITNVGIGHDDYNETNFRSSIDQYFSIKKELKVSGTRTLFFLQSKK